MIGFMLSPRSRYKAFSQPPLYIIKCRCHYFWWLLSGIPLKIELPCSAGKRQTEGSVALLMPEKRWVRRCVVERGEIWSNEPIPMFGGNDEPGGAAFIRSPDVCKLVARVITRWSKLGPLWLTASTKTLKWCTKEALYYRGQFPKNTISFLTVFLCFILTFQAAIHFISVHF